MIFFQPLLNKKIVSEMHTCNNAEEHEEGEILEKS